MELSTGIVDLDNLLQGLIPGDNVVWQVDDMADYAFFADRFARKALADKLQCVYFRFARHKPLLENGQGIKVFNIDPAPGFDQFAAEVHGIIEKSERNSRLIFDNLSVLATTWATDEQLANFFQVTCPFIFELGPVAYFGLTRGKHLHTAVARIRDTTQILIDVYHVKNAMYIHPIKVWNRYSSQMFLPHRVSENGWTPVSISGEAAAVSSTALKQPLSSSVSSMAPWEVVYERLLQHRATAEEKEAYSPEIASLKHELVRMMIGDHPSFNKLAAEYFTIDDLINIRNRLIGTGRIGGKAAGMLLSRRILLQDNNKYDFAQVLEAHDSFYIGSDVFFTFLVKNNLFQLRMQLTRDSQISPEEFEEVERRFLQGQFPDDIMEQFRDMLDYFGQAPIIVRSSSLLEDRFGNAFAGKYRSEFCANQGSPEQRMQSFLHAVRLVYASAINPDALSYRHKQGLGENDEQMAILVQRVSGMPYKEYFFPPLAGVAFSRNLYAWSSRIDANKGMIRLVFGLGTHAVNRVGGDYTRIVAISHPQLRPEIGTKIIKYSQHTADVLNISRNCFESVLVSELLVDCDYPDLNLIASLAVDGYPQEMIRSCPRGEADHLVLTFNNFINKTPYIKHMDAMLSRLEEAYGQPVDTEFTARLDSDGRVKINLLQCRSLRLPGTIDQVEFPQHIPDNRILFTSSRFISGGAVHNIRYILYIDPDKYAGIELEEFKRSLGRIVGRINRHPAIIDGRIIMMGPGRWGSSNLNLGVNIGYSDIDNTAVLVEIAREEKGQIPEVSYGTHFFQDLVESGIMYLPVYPSDAESKFNERFFNSSKNVLPEIVADVAEFAEIVHLIDINGSADGLYAHILADPAVHKAICFLDVYCA
ncbi:MAG: PEP/pyruvate-binding domain-containing protein [Dehalococcoidia bacterium]|nr:PEP/pyruvate-binding domain-containing protein [Dehalococcoidia bacterium]MDD5493449.1 PEP/pyruvate-binding domain-containing protein [Dehalococcoidia bacterium]